VKNLALAAIVLALCSYSLAGTPSAPKINTQQEATASLNQKSAAQAVPHSPFATSTCSFTFTSGAKNTFLKFCVTVNGNITQIQTPAGQEHIAIGSFGEGYGICDASADVAYFDYADFGDSGNWGPSTVVSHNATSVKIVRSTADGIWTLTQTITQVAGTSSIKVVMALKNNTAIAKTAFLVRYADVDADGVFNNNFDATQNSAFGWNSDATLNPFGLMLQNVGTPAFTFDGFEQNTSLGPPPCNPFANFVGGPLTAVDGSIAMFYSIPMPKAATKTVTLSYKGF